jgi:hypothetical protein
MQLLSSALNRSVSSNLAARQFHISVLVNQRNRGAKRCRQIDLAQFLICRCEVVRTILLAVETGKSSDSKMVFRLWHAKCITESSGTSNGKPKATSISDHVIRN